MEITMDVGALIAAIITVLGVALTARITIMNIKSSNGLALLPKTKSE